MMQKVLKHILLDDYCLLNSWRELGFILKFGL